MKTAVLYIRVSTSDQATRDGQAEGLSIPAQREECYRKARALADDVQVVDEYVDAGESARSADRPALQAMLERIRTKRDIDYVIVHKIDRLARSRADDVMIGLTLKQAGATLISVTENIDETPSGMLLHAIMAGVAEFYSRNLATEALKGLTQKAKNGGTPMRAPIGYINVRDRVDGYEIRTVVPDPERADLVRWAFESYATGNYSVSQLLAELTARGFATVPTRKYPAHPLHLSNVNQMLQNPYYMGILVYRGEQYDGKHDPLVTPEVFEKVQRVLAAHYKAGERTQRHHHYLKGSLRCETCGSKFTITRAKGNGGTYLYFFCMGRAKYRKGACNQKYVLVEEVEELVANRYRSILFEPERAEAIAIELERFLAKRAADRKKELTRQQRRLARLKTESRKLLQLAYKDAIPDEVFEAEQTRIKDEMQATERAIAEQNVSIEAVATTHRSALKLLTDSERAYRAAGPKLKRQYNQSFFKAIYIGGKNIRVELAEPFAKMLEFDFMRRFNYDWEKVQEEARVAGVCFGNAKNPALVSSGQGSNYAYLVGPLGFEPRTNGL